MYFWQSRNIELKKKKKKAHPEPNTEVLHLDYGLILCCSSSTVWCLVKNWNLFKMVHSTYQGQLPAGFSAGRWCSGPHRSHTSPMGDRRLSSWVLPGWGVPLTHQFSTKCLRWGSQDPFAVYWFNKRHFRKKLMSVMSFGLSQRRYNTECTDGT